MTKFLIKFQIRYKNSFHHINGKNSILAKKLDLKFFEKSEFDRDISQIENQMFDILYDDSWMGHYANTN